MMAKNPKDRYQRPEELVSHLILLAQKLGAAGPGVDSVLFVDAPLPGQPRTRPLLVVVSAVLMLVVLIAMLGPWPPASSQPGQEQNAAKIGPGPGQAEITASGGTRLPGDGNPNVSGPLPNPEPVIIRPRDAKELVNFFQKKDPVVKVYLRSDLHLGRDTQLVFQGRDLTIEPEKELDEPPTISLRSDPAAADTPWTALTVMGRTARIRHVRFELDPGASEDTRMTAVAQQGGELTLDQCTFVQNEPTGSGQGWINSISVAASPAGPIRPTLHLTGCYFARGQCAIQLLGPAEVKASQCAFGPHTDTLFALQGGRDGSVPPSTSLNLQNCSAFVVGDSVFRLGDGTSCQLRVENCVLSSPENETAPRSLAALIDQQGSKSVKRSYASFHNCYHNLKALWVRPSQQGAPETITDWSSFAARFPVEGDKPLEWTSSPWENPKPLHALRNQHPERAFRLNINLPELRQKDHPSEMIGVEQCVWDKTYKEKLAPLEEKKSPDPVARRDERIVDPSLTAPKDNTFRTLRQALEDTRPGEVILVKHQGLLPVEPVRLENAGLDVTIKPHPGYHPILSIGHTPEQDAALFRIFDGQLKLEGLEFQLAPGSTSFKAQTVVAVMGDGQCTVKDCLATLDGGKEVPLALVTLLDPAGVMKMEPQTPQQDPRIMIEDSFVRGTGNLLAVRASRPFELRVERTLAALDGSLLVIDGSPKDPPPKGRALVTLEQATTYLTDHLVWLRASQEESKSLKGLVLTQFKSVTNCLFMSASSKSLVQLVGVDTEEQMKRLFSWGESRHNLYSNFTPSLLDQQPSGGNEGAMPPLPYDKTQWEGFTQEQDARFDRVRLSGLPAPDGPLSQVLAADFKPKPEGNLQGYGAEPDTLPKPFDLPAGRDPASKD